MAGVDALNAAYLVNFNTNTCWYCGKYVVARSQDQCKIGAWVFVQSPLLISKISKVMYYLQSSTTILDILVRASHHRLHP